MAGAGVWMVVAALLSFGLTKANGFSLWCSPRLWEGGSWTLQISHTDQGTDIWENTAKFSVDVIGQRYARQETGERFGQSYSIFYLYYFAANTLYKIQDGLCETSYIHGNLSQHCVRVPYEHAIEYLKEYLGDYDMGVWSGGVRGVKDHVEYFYATDIYQPLYEEKHGPMDNEMDYLPARRCKVIQRFNGYKFAVPSYTVTNYYNATLGIRDPSVFTPPDDCVQSRPA